MSSSNNTSSSPTSADLGKAIPSAIVATLLAVLQVALVVSGGFILAKFGYLDKKGQKVLNVLNLNLFTPALVFSKIALELTPSKVASLAIVP